MNNIVPIQEEDDLNTIFESGFYRLGGATKNVPDGCEWGNLIVSGDNDTVLQIVSDHGNNKFLKRTYQDASIWTDWVPIATATQPHEYDLSLTEGVTGSAKYFKTQDGIVHIILSAVTKSQWNTEDLVANLPEGFRPNTDLWFCAAVGDGAFVIGNCDIRVQTNGEIKVAGYAVANNDGKRDITSTALFIAV